MSSSLFKTNSGEDPWITLQNELLKNSPKITKIVLKKIDGNSRGIIFIRIEDINTFCLQPVVTRYDKTVYERVSTFPRLNFGN